MAWSISKDILWMIVLFATCSHPQKAGSYLLVARGSTFQLFLHLWSMFLTKKQNGAKIVLGCMILKNADFYQSNRRRATSFFCQSDVLMNTFLSRVFLGLTMFGKLANCYHIQLKPTPIKDLKPDTFTNIAGVINQPFQSPRITKYKSYYQLISLQGALSSLFSWTWQSFLTFLM